MESRQEDMTALAPAMERQAFEAFLATAQYGTELFSDRRCGVLERLSETILTDRRLRHDPAAVALAYWLRDANLKRLRRELENRARLHPQSILLPVGRVFHIAPRNVDTLFLYSWALSYVSGNANIVRLSSQRSPLTEGLLELLNLLMQQDTDLRERNWFVSYAHDSQLTEQISQWCSLRLVWGGNDTIAAVRQVKLNPHAAERTFSSKFSYSVIAAGPFSDASDEVFGRVISGFFNDMFWFDQKACSSPQIIFWVGTPEVVRKVIDRFNTCLNDEASRRRYSTSDSLAMLRLNEAFELAASPQVNVDLQHSAFISVELSDYRRVTRNTCGGGLLKHVRIEDVDSIADFVNEEDQTITHFGLAPQEIKRLAVTAGTKGVDRIVPIGQALDFAPVWDGYDLLTDFTRHVSISS